MTAWATHLHRTRAITGLHASSGQTWSVLARLQHNNRARCFQSLCEASAAPIEPLHADAIEQRKQELISKYQPRLEAAPISKEDAEYWEKVVEGLDKPQSLDRLEGMEYRQAYGVTAKMLSKAQKPSCYDDFVAAKTKHPRKIVVCRIGEFYESFGLDAVLLMHFCALNPMGNRTIPHAGFPHGNIDEMIRRLVAEHGFSLVVLEEVPTSGVRKRLERIIAGVVTPARPYYLYGRIDHSTDLTQELETAWPILGVASTVSGYKIIEVNVELLRYSVQEGLTEDSVTARLYRGGLAPPLYVHQAQRRGPVQLTEASAEREWEMRIAQFCRSQAGSVQYYHSHDPVQGLLEEIQRDQALRSNQMFEQVQPDPRRRCRFCSHCFCSPVCELLTIEQAKNAANPYGRDRAYRAKRPQDKLIDARHVASDHQSCRSKALFNCTAGQLGLHQAKGVPSLLDSLLPATTPKRSRAYLRKLLLHPPPPEVAASIRKANELLSGLTVSLPKWVVMDSSHVARFIKEQECSVEFFRDLKEVLRGVHSAIFHPGIRPAADEILQAVMLETGISFSGQSLGMSCGDLAELVDEVVEDVTTVAQDSSAVYLPATTGETQSLTEFFAYNENFVGKVRDALIRKELQAVESARSNAAAAFQAALQPLERAGDLNKHSQPRASRDIFNNSVWIKVLKNSKAYYKIEALNKSGQQKYIAPRDRNGKAARSKDLYSTEALEEAMAEYRTACESARQAVRTQLKLLAASLQDHLSDLVGATVFSLIASSLEAHVREALERGWTLPTQLHLEDSLQADGTEEALPIQINEMWPYWLDGRNSDTIRNSLDLSKMTILTGPNMAGKSTVMRSLCSVAVLAACGLYAPAASATLPYIDAFMLRTFSADSPVSGKSSFAIEMDEVRHVIENVSRHSLVLVDELGKGTEPHAGTCIAASFVEYLANVGCRGMFATHLHHLLDMEGLQLQNVNFMCMETVDLRTLGSQDVIAASRGMGSIKDVASRMGERVPTWRIIPGTCRHSLAFVVMAQHCGETHSIVQRALNLYKGWTASQEQSAHSFSTPNPGNLELCDLAEAAAPRLQQKENLLLGTGPLRRIEDAQSLLEELAGHVFTRLASYDWNEKVEAAALDDTQNAANSLAFESGLRFQSESQVVRRNQTPPPSTVGRSAVYVVRRADGKFYVGETDDIKARLATHRRTSSGRVRGGPDMEAVYILVPVDLQGKSAARDFEACLIQRLVDEGFPLLSVADSRTQRSPRRKA